MKKTYNNDEALKKLIKDEGLLSAPHDLTSRIMSQVEQYNYNIETVYRPLIGTKGWFIIGASVFMLIACCIMIIVSGNYTSPGYLDFLQPVFNFFGNLEISWNINIGSVFIGTMVFISIIILLTVDVVFNTSIKLE